MDHNDGGRIDRISQLHDDLLKHILSFLPIKDVRRTSVLSKNWKYEWLPSTACLDFTYLPGGSGSRWCDCEDSEGNRNCFKHYVDGVLSHHAESSVVKRCLFGGSSSYPSPYLDRWMSTVLSYNLQELYISFSSGVWGDDLSPNLFRCPTLKILKVVGALLLDPPLDVCLPQLKTLSLRDNMFKDDSAMQRIFSGCSCLEELDIEMLWSHEAYNAIIHVPSLKRLAFHASSTGKGRLEITAPSLESLILVNNMATEIGGFDFSDTLVGASIDGQCASIIIGKISHVQNLTVRASALMCLSTTLYFTPPQFGRLNSLELELNADTCSSFLSRFLQKSPKLRTLRISWIVKDEGCYGYNGSMNPPLCLVGLKRIEFHNCHGTTFERSVVRYMLQHGTSLDQISFWLSFGSETDEMVNFQEEILQYQKSSSTCQVHFSRR